MSSSAAAIAYALAAASVYGAADFLGGLATRRTSASAVVVISQAIGFAAALCLLPFVSGRFVLSDIGWGALAGIGGAAGIALLYRALALGRMAIVSPITAVIAAAVPAVYGFAVGGRLEPAALAGIALAFVAVVLVSMGTSTDAGRRQARHDERPALVFAAGSGIALGAFYVLLSKTGTQGGLFPLLGARAASIVVCTMFAFAFRETLRPARESLPIISGAGILDIAANAFYLFAAHTGQIVIAAVLTSLYPASTVLLARLVLKERLSAPQWIGVGCAGLGVVLIAK